MEVHRLGPVSDWRVRPLGHYTGWRREPHGVVAADFFIELQPRVGPQHI